MSWYRFAELMKGLNTVYSQQDLADISVSYGFICLLHLANENGLLLRSVPGLLDIEVERV